MASQRLSITLSEDVVQILKSKANKSGFITDSIREKVIRNKRREIRATAKRLQKYYVEDKELHVFSELESDDFLE